MSSSNKASKRSKQFSSSAAAPAGTAALPHILAHDVFMGTNVLRSGRGARVNPPSAAGLAKAAALFQAVDPAVPAVLPTGADWVALPIVSERLIK
jgi:hypothetical protein